METIDDFLCSEIDVGSFPAAAYAVGTAAGITHENAHGHAVAVPLRLAATTDTIFDCASITKPLITTTLLLQAVGEGKISLDDSFEGFPYRQLLTHTSGLTAWLPLYAYSGEAGGMQAGPPSEETQQRSRTRPDAGATPGVSRSHPYVEAILARGREYEPGTKTVYSDLNFILLYFALTQIYGDYVAAANERIFRRLALRDAMFVPPPALRPRIAATEWAQRFEQGMCSTRSVKFNGFREGLIWGQTHDGNSHHNGGTAGNAGLFATAGDVFRIAQGITNGTLISTELLAEATRNATAGMSENRGLGWLLSAPGHVATKMLSPRAFGHTGFTGTSVWIDPDRDRIMVLLTNRVHPCSASTAMQEIRGEFHRLSLG